MKPTPVPKSKVPDLQGVSLSPVCVGAISGACSSPTRSPVPVYTSPVNKWNYECQSDEFSGSVSSSDEFSDEDLNEACGSQEVARMLSHDPHEDLKIIGSKPRLHPMFEVPMIKPSPSKIPYVNKTPQPEPKTPDYDLDFERDCSSPENPPPSPINFRPSMEGFVVGGKKIKCQEKTSCRQSYSARDFTPGFVKYPLYHCNKCEGRVMDEEQSQAALHRRQCEFLRSRASPYRRDGSVFMSRLSYRSRPDSNPGLLECEHDARSFIEIYTEKKRQKEEREKERCTPKLEINLKEQQKVIEPDSKSFGTSCEYHLSSDSQHGQVSEKQHTSTSSGANISTDYDNQGSKDSLSSRQFIPALRRTSTSKFPSVSDIRQTSKGSLSDLGSASSRLQLGNISDLSLAQTVQGKEIPPPKLPFLSRSTSVVLQKCQKSRKETPQKLTQLSSRSHPRHLVGKRTAQKDITIDTTSDSQVRRCWSDIWPIPKNPDVKQSQVDFEIMEDSRPKSSMLVYRMGRPLKSRISPCCPLIQSSSSNKGSDDISKSSVTRVSSTEVNAEIKDVEASFDDDLSETEQTEEAENDFTLKATVIVPPKEKPCSQWITFNTDDEPVLNNALVTDKGCDNFLKRLQRTKLFPDHDTGGSIPMGQQFCFEPVTDKRYNRWKRRRRKKKETEFRRSTMTLQCDSSDEDSNEREMERIIGHMYEEIHGPAPATPNGTSDTPRMRNRRRRRQLACRSETKLTDNDPDSLDLHYDASSEWMTSDKSDDEITIDVFKNQRRKSSHGTERHAYSAGYERRLLSSTMMEVRSAQQATKYHSLQAPIHRSFDPSIIDKRPLSSAVAEVRSAYEAPVQQSVQTVIHLSTDQSVKESYPPADEYRLETPLKEECMPDKNVDDMCTWPYLDQYREQIMERVKCSPTDDVMNKDWLPEIPNPISPIGSGRGKHTYEAGNLTDTASEVKAVEPEQGPSGPTPLLKDPVIQVRERSNSDSSDSQAKTKTKPKGILPLNLPSSSLKDARDSKSSSSKDFEDSKFARKSRQFTKPEQALKSISRSSASNWSELGMNPKQPKPIGVVSVGGCTETGLQVSTSSFKASLRPVRPNETLSSQKLAIKPDLKYNKAPKKKEFSLPKLNKPTVRAQPNIRRRNSFLNTDRKVKKAIKPEIARTERLQTIPLQDGARKIPKSVNLDPQAEFLFRDFYLRRLYGKKMRLNSHVQSIKRSTPVKQTLTVERLDNVKKKPATRAPQEKERSVSNLSFTRAFTFSMFDLPDVYKMYNKRLERNAELSDSVGSLLSVQKAVTRA